MSGLQSLIFRAVLGALLLASGAHNAGAGELFATVDVQSGRRFHGAVSERTNEQQLWLKTQGPSTTVMRPIEWAYIVSADVQGQHFNSAELRTHLQSVDLAAIKAQKTPVIKRWTEEEIMAKEQATRALQALEAQSAIQSIDFDLRLGNWDRDAATDGFWVDLWAYNALGQITTARATVDLQVWAYTYERLTRGSTRRNQGLVRLGRWAKTLTPADFYQQHAQINFAFRGPHPRNASLSRYGVAELRFSIPGQGVFTRRIDGVLIADAQTP